MYSCYIPKTLALTFPAHRRSWWVARNFRATQISAYVASRVASKARVLSDSERGEMGQALGDDGRDVMKKEHEDGGGQGGNQHAGGQHGGRTGLNSQLHSLWILLPSAL